MVITDENKNAILLAALEERYTSIRTIRERVQNIGVWTLGLLLGAGGWTLKNQNIFNTSEKILVVIGIMTAVAVLCFYYLEDLRKGFNSQLRTAARLEKTLGLFSVGLFDDENDPLYPKKWEASGAAGGDGRFFHSTYVLLAIGAIFLVATILFGSCCSRESNNIKQTKSHPLYHHMMPLRGLSDQEIYSKKEPCPKY